MRKSVLVVGAGARECAIVRKLNESVHCPKIYCYGRHINPAIKSLVIDYKGSLDYKWEHVYDFCCQRGIEMVVIGPEVPLEEGLVDALESKGIKAIGPYKNLAFIETSKSYLRALMNSELLMNYQPKWKYFGGGSYSMIDLFEWIEELGEYVVKLDGLCGGKGVKLSGEHIKGVSELLKFVGGESFIVEEKLVGEEFTLMSFSDGNVLKHMPIVKDFKRRDENNLGPNTGGMGSISYPSIPPFLTEDDYETAKDLNYWVIREAQRKNGVFYKGVVYGSFMKTKEGIKIIEYNARFGDPECVNIMSVLETDLLEIFNGIIDGTLKDLDINYKPVFSSCFYTVPYYYPFSGDRIVYTDLDLLDPSVVPANVLKDNKGFRILSSRAVCYVETGDTLEEISYKFQKRFKQLEGNSDLHFRRDIPISLCQKSSCYEDSGVSIEEGNAVVRKIRDLVESTYDASTICNFGDFGGLYKFGGKILVSSTDGVGTKSIPVLEYGKYGVASLGHDIVNHCVNDILVKGAEPLFFLDYFASSKLDSETVSEFVEGVANACKLSGTVLIGGETAEMPDVYK